MVERLTLDTNVLIYSQDGTDPRKQAIASELIVGLRDTNARLTTVVLGEFFSVATRKFMSAAMARAHLKDFAALVPIVSYGPQHLLRAAEEAQAGRFSFWDAVMLASAEDAGCTTCFSEDMDDGARLGNIVVRNPFGPRGLHEEIRAFLMP